MTGPERCTFRPWPPHAQERGPECGRPAPHTEYADQGRYELPRCTEHYQPTGAGPFKGPEDL